MTNTIYRNDDLTGTAGDHPTAGNIGMSTLTGIPVYVAPGWKLATAVQYPSGAFGTLNGTFASVHYLKEAFKIASTTSNMSILRWRNASSTVVEVIVTTAGKIQLSGSSGSVETTEGTYFDVWTPVIVYINQLKREAVLRIYDRTEERTETLRVTIGATALTVFREGAITGGGSITFAESLMQTDPIYVDYDAPNIVYMMGDDMPGQAYLKHMTEVQSWMDEGAILDYNFEASPLCAPSRANLMSGKYGQNNGVFTNAGATDAYLNFSDTNQRQSIYALMSDLGYRVAHFGKTLHGYDPGGNDGTDPLWAWQGIDWALITAEGYQEFDIEATQTRDGTAVLYDTTGAGSPEGDYLTDVFSAHIEAFIDDHHARFPGLPFFILYTPFAGHNNVGGPDPEDPGGPSYPPAPRDRPIYDGSSGRPGSWDPPEFPDTGDLGANPPDGIGVPDYWWEDQATNWNTKPQPIPGWMDDSVRTPPQLQNEADDYLDVVRQCQSVNDSLIALREQLEGYGWWDDTFAMATSDNGYDRGEHGLPGGKGTSYDQACRLPLVVRGPGMTVEPGYILEELTQPIDVLSVLLEIGGVLPSPGGVTAYDTDGMSWLGFLTGNPPEIWRETILMQYVSGDVSSWEDALGGNEPPDWFGLRSLEALFVTYDPASALPPDSNRGEAYFAAEDPGLVINLYPDMMLAQSMPIMSLLQAFLSGAGDTSRAAQYRSFALGVGGSSADRRWSMMSFGGAVMDLNDCSHAVAVSFPSIAARRGRNQVRPKKAGRKWNSGKMHDEADITMVMFASGSTGTGMMPLTDSARYVCRRALDQMSTYFVSGRLLEIQRTFGGETRVIEAEVVEAIDMSTVDDRYARFIVQFKCPHPFWRDAYPLAQTIEIEAEQNDEGVWFDDVWFTAFAGSTAYSQSWKLTLKGDIRFPGFFDATTTGYLSSLSAVQLAVSGANTGNYEYVYYDGILPDPTLTLELDSDAFTAIKIDSDDGIPHDEIEQIQVPHGVYPTLHPRLRDEGDGAYGIQVSAVIEPGGKASAKLEGYRWFVLHG